MSSTVLLQIHAILGFARARSCMIIEARRVSRRWSTVTRLANFVRKIASSIAESPPPTTSSSWPLKKKPSQVAQVERPRPRSFCSAGRPSILAEAPVDTMRARPRTVRSAVFTVNGRWDRSTPMTSSSTTSAPKRSAWRRMTSISSGPMIPSTKPG